MRLFWFLFIPAALYQLLAIIGALRHLLANTSEPRPSGSGDAFRYPGVSVLKPLRGLDPNTYEAFVSQARQDYPSFEILFGAQNADDSAVPEVRRLQREFPNVAIHLFIGALPAPNGKVGVLMELARHAQYPVWVVNDSDVRVGPTYLSTVIAPLARPEIGLVTCLYRAKAHNLPAAWESLGIATDFMPSTLVAQLIGVREFGLGSTLAFRAADLERAGGFAAIADYLADDYQLAKHITELQRRAMLSTYVVEIALADSTWPGVWRHQLRWARTIRLTKGAVYAGLPIAQAGVWAVAALLCGAGIPAAILASFRIVSALLNGWFVLRSPAGAAFCWLAPLWDLYAFAVWMASYAGNQVRWRDRVLSIDPCGRIRGSL
ncbi:MAG: glycosyltransferase [Bryobacteraceae bacterium]